MEFDSLADLLKHVNRFLPTPVRSDEIVRFCIEVFREAVSFGVENTLSCDRCRFHLGNAFPGVSVGGPAWSDSYCVFQLSTTGSGASVICSDVLSPDHMPVRSKVLELLYRAKCLDCIDIISSVLKTSPTMSVPRCLRSVGLPSSCATLSRSVVEVTMEWIASVEKEMNSEENRRRHSEFARWFRAGMADSS